LKIHELAQSLGLKALNSITEKEISGVLIADIVSDVVMHARPGVLVITAQPHTTLVAAAKLGNVSAIVYTRGREPLDDTKLLAENAGITLLRTDLSAYELAGKLIELGL
jgi:hypothetical protein